MRTRANTRSDGLLSSVITDTLPVQRSVCRRKLDEQAQQEEHDQRLLDRAKRLVSFKQSLDGITSCIAASSEQQRRLREEREELRRSEAATTSVSIHRRQLDEFGSLSPDLEPELRGNIAHRPSASPSSEADAAARRVPMASRAL